MADLKISEEHFLNLFDSNWFNHTVFQNPTNPFPQENHEFSQETNTSHFLPNLHVRSLSDQILSFPPKCHSPNTSKLRKIFSGEKFEDQVEEPGVKKEEISEKKQGKKQRKKQGRSSKSLSDLEFEELKGFMDLGFVFCEEDKDSSLVSIIPGLHRLGKEEDEIGTMNESEIERPYLSEAWEDLDHRTKEMKMNNPLMNWRIPVLGNEMYIKDQLRFWAHTVASTVK